MSKIKFLHNKLTKVASIARLATKLADQQVQYRRFMLGSYKFTKQAPGNVKAFGNRFMNKLEYSRNAPGVREAILRKSVTAEDIAIVKQMDSALQGGANGLKNAIKNRRRAGKALAEAVTKTKPETPIHRAVNARAKGISFRRIGGRIVPIRPKK